MWHPIGFRLLVLMMLLRQDPPQQYKYIHLQLSAPRAAFGSSTMLVQVRLHVVAVVMVGEVVGIGGAVVLVMVEVGAVVVMVMVVVAASSSTHENESSSVQKRT